MRAFDYDRPRSRAQAVRAALNGAVPLAGGTDLLTLMKADIVQPAWLVDVKGIEDAALHEIRRERDGALRIGALVTVADVEQSEAIRARAPMLADAAGLAATTQIRNRATVGGNLLQRPRCWYYRAERFHCWLQGGDDCPAEQGENQLHALFGGGPCFAVHPSDLAPVLVALDARVQLVGIDGDRSLAVSELFALPDPERRRETVIRDGELLVGITIPRAAAGERSVFLKAMDRAVWSFALASVAIRVTVTVDGVADPRIVLGGVAPVPWRATAAEVALVAPAPAPRPSADGTAAAAGSDDAVLRDVAEAALDGAHALAQNGYKRDLVRNLVARGLRMSPRDGA